MLVVHNLIIDNPYATTLALASGIPSHLSEATTARYQVTERGAAYQRLLEYPILFIAHERFDQPGKQACLYDYHSS